MIGHENLCVEILEVKPIPIVGLEVKLEDLSEHQVLVTWASDR